MKVKGVKKELFFSYFDAPMVLTNGTTTTKVFFAEDQDNKLHVNIAHYEEKLRSCALSSVTVNLTVMPEITVMPNS
jgi:hypothetical protein